MKINIKLIIIVFILFAIILYIGLIHPYIFKSNFLSEKFSGNSLLDAYNSKIIQEQYDAENIIFINNKLKLVNDKYNKLLNDYMQK
jgi:hypothetical protein